MGHLPESEVEVSLMELAVQRGVLIDQLSVDDNYKAIIRTGERLGKPVKDPHALLLVLARFEAGRRGLQRQQERQQQQRGGKR
jgi:hypothetical protein